MVTTSTQKVLKKIQVSYVATFRIEHNRKRIKKGNLSKLLTQKEKYNDHHDKKRKIKNISRVKLNRDGCTRVEEGFFTKTPRGRLIIDPDDKCSLISRSRLMNFHCKTPLCWATAEVK